MSSSFPCGFLAVGLALALGGCGDDTGGGDPMNGDTTTGGATMGSMPTTGGPAPQPTDGSGGETTQDDAGSTASDAGSTASDASSGGMPSDGTATDDGSGSESGADETTGSTGGEASGSSDDGMTLPGCEMCEDGEVCVANQAFETTYECQPLPAACEGDVDCECGASLCVDPFVGCFDPPEADTLFCACIAC